MFFSQAPDFLHQSPPPRSPRRSHQGTQAAVQGRVFWAPSWPGAVPAHLLVCAWPSGTTAHAGSGRAHPDAFLSPTLRRTGREERGKRGGSGFPAEGLQARLGLFSLVLWLLNCHLKLADRSTCSGFMARGGAALFPCPNQMAHLTLCLTSYHYCCLLQEALPDCPVEKSCAFLFRCPGFNSPLPHPSLFLTGCVMPTELLHLSDLQCTLSVQ